MQLRNCGLVRYTYQLGAVLILAALWQSQGSVDWQWRKGRATNYGGSGDPWSLHYGSCGYYYLDPTVNKGWDTAALADAVDDFAGSCGRCYEIACDPSHINDGYGTGLDRTSACHDPSKSVTVMITDSCPCNYPPNYYSNKRWCCADYYHFDMSLWAYEKLADQKWGVIGVKYREVPCDYCPENPATPPGGWPSQPVQSPPSGWQSSWDKRPYGKMCFKSSIQYQDGSGGSGDSSGTSTSASTPSSSSSSSHADANSGSSGSSSDSSGAGAGSAGTSIGGNPFGSASFLSGWQNWSYKVGNSWQAQGPDGSNAWCGTLQGYGAVQFKGGNGNFGGKQQLQFNIKADSNGKVPDITLMLKSSQKGNCRTIDLSGLSSGQRNGDWMSFTIPLINLSWDTHSWNSSPMEFFGCGSNIGYWDVDTIVFQNKWGGDQQLCLGSVSAW